MHIFAIVVIAMFLWFLALPDAYSTQTLIDTLEARQQGYFGTRRLADVVIPNVYFKATLFAVPAFAYALWMRQSKSAYLFVVLLALAFSKAGIAYCFFLTMLWTLGQLLRGRVPFAAIAFSALVVTGLFLAISSSILAYIDLMMTTLSGSGETVDVRVGHVQSIVDLFVARPEILLIGQGVGTEFFSIGANALVADIELDHIDAVRQFGLPWTLAFSVLFGASVLSLLNHGQAPQRAFAIALIGLFVVAGTNPVLINPLTMSLLAISLRWADYPGSVHRQT